MATPPNTSLGEFTLAPQPSSSPATYQPIQLENTATLEATYGEDHVPLGSVTDAGYHKKVTLSPQEEAPTPMGSWQLYADSNNIYMVPPNEGSVPQQLNSTAIPSSPTYWTSTITVNSSLQINIYYYLPLGTNKIEIIIQFNYSGSTGASVVFIPFKDSTGANLIFSPTYGLGLLGISSSIKAAPTIGLAIYPFQGTVQSPANAVYTNGVSMTIGNTVASPITVSSHIYGVVTNG